jgi:hypothetical protein
MIYNIHKFAEQLAVKIVTLRPISAGKDGREEADFFDNQVLR